MSDLRKVVCDCCSVDRREFFRAAGGAALAAGAAASLTRPVWAQAKAASASEAGAESLVKKLYDTLSEEQRKVICFDWDHMDAERGLLRTRVANNWNITEDFIKSDFYTDDQRDLVRSIFQDIIHPDWHDRIDKQQEDDAGGWGEQNSIAIFGKPGDGKFEFVFTGRHCTLRCDGNSADHVAFGGPIFYGHAADTFNEGPDHPGNVFWPQAVAANGLFQMLDGKQRDLALIQEAIPEHRVGFRGKDGMLPGIPVTEMSADQKEHLQKVVQKLVEPYRQSDRDEAIACLKSQGGLDACSLAFFKEGDIGNDGVWDIWRLEGPSFVWHFRGSPHVHVWVNIADSADVKLNAQG
jgi:hypothetical protein